jgi:transcriptional regulator with XRE-family HTH domain
MADKAIPFYGAKLSALRDERLPRVTQRELANRIGVSTATISNWERFEIAWVHRGNAHRLAAEFKMTDDELNAAAGVPVGSEGKTVKKAAKKLGK